ncbi:MAG: RagB/SusD family nutrient uptake outer membrane protein [Bacteroidia bacterium]|nr:RagB/SusD family nutrient uptake outer membrane protein [Bacteroidia bacterium]
MKLNKFVIYLLAMLTGFSIMLTSCNIEEIPNPNGPDLEALLEGATLADIQLLANGLESVLRNDLEFYVQVVSIVGREYWDLNGVDPRYTGELLGEQGAPLDNNGFLTTRSFAARYRAVKNAQVLIDAVPKSTASLSQAQQDGLVGYAKTVQAYALLLVINRQFDNGIRLPDAVADPDNLGNYEDGYEASLAGIKALLDEAEGLLDGGEFVFDMSSGFAGSGLDDAAGFLKFNRAIAARVALYQENNTEALDALSKSFMDLNGGLDAGAYHAYGGAVGNDRPNPMFYIPDQDLFVVHPSWVSDADSNDLRVAAKTRAFDTTNISTPVSLADLSGDTQVATMSSNTAPFPIIRNEELILIYAEANIGVNNDEAVAALNIIRAAAGISAYDGSLQDADILNDVLRQRRYSLFGEAHRWVDLRRLGRLSEVPIDRTGDIVHTKFPRPLTELE